MRIAGGIGVGTVGSATALNTTAKESDDIRAIERHIKEQDFEAANARAEEAGLYYEHQQNEYEIEVRRKPQSDSGKQRDDEFSTHSLVSESSLEVSTWVGEHGVADDRHFASFSWNADRSSTAPFYNGDGDAAALFWSDNDFRGVAGKTNYWSSQDGLNGDDLIEARLDSDLLTSSHYAIEFDADSPCISACNGGESFSILTSGGISTHIEERSGTYGDTTVAGEYAHAYSFTGNNVSFSFGDFNISVSGSSSFAESETINYTV